MGYVFVMEHSLNHLNQSLVEPFYNTIRFRAIWWNVLLLNAFQFAMILENFRNELTIVVILDGLDISF
jgi:sRNA-binding regulator protein Hfq